jgi:hypothetical protein
MKFTPFAFLFIAVLGCSLVKPSPPSPEKIRAALDKVIKKENPKASYSITSTDVHDSGKLITIQLAFENFEYVSITGKGEIRPSGKASATINYTDKGKWILETIQVKEPEVDFIRCDLEIE